MKKITHWIAAKLIKEHQSVNNPKVRCAYGELEGWSSIVINLLLFFVKIVLGISIKSVSLIADAIHTLSDSGSSIVVIIGFKMAGKPSDKEHPFGHGRMESIASLIVSVLLFMAGIELLEKSFLAVIHPKSVTAPVWVIVVVTGTIVIKELMARFSYHLGEIIDSQSLKADALHHRTDAITTILVVVALISTRSGYNYIDGIMGLIVSLVIFYSAYSITKAAINPLLGQAPSTETIKKIEKSALGHEGVLGVHDVIFHKYGQTNVISLHIEVSDSESACALHALAERVEDSITSVIPGMAVVHVDPINKNHPQYELIRVAVKEIVSGETRVNSFHDLRIVGHDPARCNVVFDIVLEQNANELETDDIIGCIIEKFKAQFPKMKISIKVEPKYAYTL